MRYLIHLFIALGFISCSPDYKFEDFELRNDVIKSTFMKNKLICQKHSKLLEFRSEGSKGAGEMAIERNKYFLSCMKSAGWVLRTSS